MNHQAHKGTSEGPQPRPRRGSRNTEPAPAPANPGYVTARRWDFHRRGDTEGWTIPPELGGQVRGSALWITPAGRFRETGPERNPPFWDLYRMSGGTWIPSEIRSPAGVGIAAASARKVRLRLLNHSPETDGEVSWTTAEEPERVLGPVCFPMLPYHGQWQEIVVHLDDVAWNGTLDQLRLIVGTNAIRGDIDIDWIAVTDGALRVRPPKPDIRGPAGIPVIAAPGISQDQFAAAWDVLNDAVIHDPLPLKSFPAPFLAPGAVYGRNWWVLDASLAMIPLLWTDLGFCRDMIRGFISVQGQNPDGNINHEGNMCDRGMPNDLSVLPRYFEATHALAAMTTDRKLIAEIYDSMRHHLDWWTSPVKRDPAVGLVTAMFEESFTGHIWFTPGSMATVDTNVAVAVGAELTAQVAERLGLNDQAATHRSVFAELSAAINARLWNPATGCYQNWHIPEQRWDNLLASHMFDPLRCRIAPPDRTAVLLERLTDPAQFGWGNVGLTTLSHQDPRFQTKCVVAPFNWDGDVWTMRNLPVITGLRDQGRHDLATELIWTTLKLFAGNYAECLDPIEGLAHGEKRYAWTAGQWLQTVIEQLFGITYDALARRLTLFPHIPAALAGQTLSLRNLVLPAPTPCPLEITVRVGVGGDWTFRLSTSGEPPVGHQLEIHRPAGTGVSARTNGRELGAPTFHRDGSVAWELPLARQVEITGT